MKTRTGLGGTAALVVVFGFGWGFFLPKKKSLTEARLIATLSYSLKLVVVL